MRDNGGGTGKYLGREVPWYEMCHSSSIFCSRIDTREIAGDYLSQQERVILKGIANSQYTMAHPWILVWKTGSHALGFGTLALLSRM